MHNKHYAIGNIKISIVNLSTSLRIIDKALNENRYNYICVTNSRTSYLANHDPSYCQIQNNSMLTVPDGMPLVWIAHNNGFKEVGKVSGKDLMDALFSLSKEKGYSHYFFGSTPQTISQLQNNLHASFEGIQIKGAVSPPFQPLDKFDIDSLANEINQLNPTFFWCGLGAPKQEHFIALLQPKLTSTICVGVGLAFEYIASTVRRPPTWIRKIGFEWLYRCLQQPQRVNLHSLRMIFSILPVLFKSLKYKYANGER